MPPKFKALARMSFGLRRPSQSSTDVPPEASSGSRPSSVKAPSRRGSTASQVVERADHTPPPEAAKKPADDTPVAPSVRSALVAGDEAKPAPPPAKPAENEYSLASPMDSQFPPVQPPVAQVLLPENGHLHDEPDSIKGVDPTSGSKAPSLKPPSVNPPSVKAPSVNAPSIKAPSIKAPSVKALSVKAPSVKAPSAKAESIAEVTNAQPGAIPGPTPQVVGTGTSLAADRIAGFQPAEPQEFPFNTDPSKLGAVEPTQEQLDASASTIQQAWKAKKERRAAAYAAAASASASRAAKSVETPPPEPAVSGHVEQPSAEQKELDQAALKIQKTWKARQFRKSKDTPAEPTPPRPSDRVFEEGYAVGPVSASHAWQVPPPQPSPGADAFGENDGLLSSHDAWRNDNSEHAADSTTRLIKPQNGKMSADGRYESFTDAIQHASDDTDDMENLSMTDWKSHAIPTGPTYFTNPKLHVVTDIDLRLPGNLRRVTTYVAQSTPYARSKLNDQGWYEQSDEHRPGVEMWLRSLNTDEFAPQTLWVDHRKKSVSAHSPSTSDAVHDHRSGEAAKAIKNGEETIKYWSYMERHPVHAALPDGAEDEANQILTWAYSDSLLRTTKSNSASSPFSAKESRELLDLMKSINPSTPGGTSATAVALRTRITAQVMHRISKHRQTIFTDSASLVYHADTEADDESPTSHLLKKSNNTRISQPGLLMSLFCLGIPNLFATKQQPPPQQHHSRYGATASESSSEVYRRGGYGGPPHHPSLWRGGMVADSPAFAGSVTLTAALLLTASISFLSVPGLDNASRLASLLSLLCASSSLGASLVNLQHRRRCPRSPDGENQVQQQQQPESQHYYVKSLPLLFLTWSLLGLVVSVILYSFRGDIGAPGHIPGRDDVVIADIMRWIVVGVGSTLTLVLLIAAWVARATR